MKERPIIFSGPMIRAILNGKKTMTRRIVKPQPTLRNDVFYKAFGKGNKRKHFYFPNSEYYPGHLKGVEKWCPYGIPGDRLWVKEAWRVGAWNEEASLIAVDYKADNHAREEWLNVERADEIEPGGAFNKLFEESIIDAEKAKVKFDEEGQWRSPLYMPRKASRITLEITNIRVDRLQEITEEDAKAEGVISDPELHSSFRGRAHIRSFKNLWNSIHGPDAWEVNPWVWVIEFKKIDP